MSIFPFDIWSIVHLVGCFALTLLCYWIHYLVSQYCWIHIWKFQTHEAYRNRCRYIWTIPAILACVWELVIDEFAGRLLHLPWADARGGDVLDLIVDAIGILIAWLILNRRK